MPQIDRFSGLVGSIAWKVPCRAATTAAITLSAEQTIDGIACVTGDRVLVKDQASGVDNGIYVVDTGTWSRADDCDGQYDLVAGSQVYVTSGNSNGGGTFIVTTTGDITVGTTSIAFARSTINSVTRSKQVAAAGQTVFTVPTYQVGANTLAVYLNGLRMYLGDDYTETSATSITTTYALSEGDELVFYAGATVGNFAVAEATNVTVTDAGDFYVGATVEAVLQEIAMSMTPDIGDASVTLTNSVSNRVARWNTPLTQNRTATLSTSNAKEGAGFYIVRGPGATGNYTLSVGSICTLYAPGEWCHVRYDAGTAAWILVGWGFLPSAGAQSIAAVGDADATLTVGTSQRVQRWTTTLTADRTATLATTTAWAGAEFRIVRDEAATGNFSLIVAVGSTTLCRLAPGQWVVVAYTGTTWVVVGMGMTRNAATSLVTQADDFTGNEINGYWWQSVIGSDSACRQATVLADQVGGVVRLTTGAGAGATMAVNGTQLQSRLNWRASQGGLSCEWRIAIDTITTVCVYLGLTDQVTDLEMPFTLAAGDVLTANATNAVGVLYDTAADTDNWWLVGVAAGVAATKQNSAVAPSAGTFETWRIEVSATGVASFYRNNTLIGSAMTGAVNSGAQLTPVLAAFARAASSRNIDADVAVIQAQR